MARLQCNFISYTLGRAVDITVIIPSPTIPDTFDGTPLRHTPRDNYPVMYLLHGMGNNHATWTGYSNVEMFAEERQIAVVMISAENKFYIKVGVDDFFSFVSKELPDFVCGMFPISEKPDDTYIAGLSMGGFGAYIHALSFPERFKAFGAFSAAVRLNPARISNLHGIEIADEYDPYKLAEKISINSGTFPKAYIACGAKDFLFEDNQNFRDYLLKLGVDLTWVEHPDYGHEWRFWNWQVEAFLDWIPRTDKYSKIRRTV